MKSKEMFAVKIIEIDRQQSTTPLHTKPEGLRLVGDSPRLQGAGTP
jgi:hypothetical protein